ncbi:MULTISPECIES: hypothetical protein [Bacillus]|uniref:hypothetical protein n=1 Tax=Bacillus TaxID=1386 RepID=UPI00065DD172|nr:hypothetical protein [Bacillus smithii]
MSLFPLEKRIKNCQSTIKPFPIIEIRKKNDKNRVLASLLILFRILPMKKSERLCHQEIGFFVIQEASQMTNHCHIVETLQNSCVAKENFFDKEKDLVVLIKDCKISPFFQWTNKRPILIEGTIL